MCDLLQKLLADQTGGAIFQCFDLYHLCFILFFVACGIGLCLYLKNKSAEKRLCKTKKSAALRQTFLCSQLAEESDGVLEGSLVSSLKVCIGHLEQLDSHNNALDSIDNTNNTQGDPAGNNSQNTLLDVTVQEAGNTERVKQEHQNSVYGLTHRETSFPLFMYCTFFSTYCQYKRKKTTAESSLQLLKF